jgi:hypothetical protein
LNCLEFRFFRPVCRQDTDYSRFCQLIFGVSYCFAKKPLDPVAYHGWAMLSGNKNAKFEPVTGLPEQSKKRGFDSCPRFEECPDIALA